MKKVSMTLAKATPEDFKLMWAVSRAHQNLAWADTRLRRQRLKMLIVSRLEQLSAGGLMRVVMGCEMLIAQVCDPDVDHYALKPVYGAAPALLEASKRLAVRGFFNPVSCADEDTLADMQKMQDAILDAAGGAV